MKNIVLTATLLTLSLIIISGCANNSNLPAQNDVNELRINEPSSLDIDYMPIDEQNEVDILLACDDFVDIVTVRTSRNSVNVELEGSKRISRAKFEKVARDIATYVKTSRGKNVSVYVTFLIDELVVFVNSI